MFQTKKTLPLMKRFYMDPYLHIRSFIIQLAVSVTLCWMLYNVRSEGFFNFNVSAWHLLLIPFGIYIGGVSAVFIHNASHGSFPNKWLNEICGHLAGFHQLWGFMGWKLIHLVHHHYSDNDEMDPHAPSGMGFWEFSKVMFIKSSRLITKRYQDHWGNGTRTQLLQKATVILFIALVTTNLTAWLLLIGPVGMVFFYIPSYIANHMLFVDINYTAHPKNPQTGITAAANLDNNLYYKIANFCWFGIYYHGNHHRKPLLFNPKYMPVRTGKRRPRPSENVAA